MKAILAVLVAVSASLAQQTQTRIPKVQSPEVQAGGRVAFRYYDPNARQVKVRLEGAKDSFSMQKDAAGIWSYTSEPLAPDLYGYSFDSDGATRLDPVNTAIKPNLLGLSNVVHVAGSQPQPWEERDIPHGTLHHHFYRSGIVGDNRDFFVYTPPGYDPAAATVYPVLYLLHGYSDDASGWSAVGKANLILDSLIADRKARPMIIVMPLGYGAPEILHQTNAFQNDDLRERNFKNFRSALIEEVMPAVERTYKVDRSREARAVAGLSMGGAESLLTGLNRLDLFSWVGAFSAGGLGQDIAASFPQLDASANDKLHLLWIACGTEDRLIEPNRKTVEWLKRKGVHVVPVETPGMHTWMVWRRNLIAFAPQLFQTQ
jgi:enterochelin esterase family protein